MSHDRKVRADLVRAADSARSRLLRTAERIDQRRHEALDIRMQVERHLQGVAVTGGAVLLASAGAAAFAGYRIATSSDRRRRARWRLVRGAWEHPERGLRAQRQSFAVEVLRSLLMTLVTAVLSEPLRRMVQGRRA
jgi:hypothetical protein